ncbi:hypothetical protein [Burkholderia diffusa]|uniref:hypothetical protein n=1 Tax=Burkholderia diffusa TaxID=488732 RepID=UPI002ABE9C4B|nr:hypothetical protein [Burkholderia diffusa]
MTTYESKALAAPAALHVFEQDGGWHWGITAPRIRGSGFKLIAFSKMIFQAEAEAHSDGSEVLATIAADAPS